MLTEEQEQAVARRHGPLALSAGAGSGKTSVLVERFVRAVREDGLAPGQVLAITFTERAAGELRERIRARLLDLGERDAARAAESAFVSTIHGFCARLLRSHPLPAGVSPGFAVIDEGQADRLRRLAFDEALAGFMEGEPAEAVDLAAAYGAASLQAIVLGAHAALRSQGESRPRLPLPPLQLPQLRQPGARSDDHDERALHAARLIDDLLCRFDIAYLRRKRERAALDFDDLELCARDLLRAHPAVLAAWRERFQMLMVDELQDINARQLELLELLDRGNLFTVGDELQSIYGFRHADVRLFAERLERLEGDGAALRLTFNFRSRPAIIEAVDRVFATRMGGSHTPLAAAREPATGHEAAVELLLTDRRGWQAADGGPDGLDGLPGAAPWRTAEARLLAERVAELVEGGSAGMGEVAVLLRAVGDMPLYEAALREHGLPVLAATGGFWGHQQVLDLLAYLRTLANPFDELALFSTLACPLVGLSSDGMVLLGKVARELRCCTWEAIDRHAPEVRSALPAPDGERVCAFGRWLSAERRSVALRPLPELLRRAIAAGGYDLHLLSLRWGQRRMANVNKLIELARRFEAQDGRDLRAFLGHAAHMSEAFAGREADATADASTDAVRLMSIHAAKGLEFPVVCVADLGRAPRTSTPELIVDRTGRLGLRLRALGEPEPLPSLEYDRLRADLLQAQRAEEDRIFYVAMTRARERLLLCGAADLCAWPASDGPAAPPIAWLAPALLPDLQALVAGEADSFSCRVSPTLTVHCRLGRPSTAPSQLGHGHGARQAEPTPQPAEPVPEPECRPQPAGRDPQHAEPSPRAAERSGPSEWLDSGWPTVRRLRVPADRAAALLSDPEAPLSYSSLAELERCGYRYYLERVLRLPERRGGRAADHAARARSRGTVIHALLEKVDFAHPQAPSSADVASAARALGLPIALSERAVVRELLERALHSELAQRIALGHDLRREHPFSISLGASEPLLVGVVDLLVHERHGSSDESLLIVDYKSDRMQAGDDPAQIAEREYGLQRLVYALAALSSGAERVQVAHWFLERPHEPALASFHAGEHGAMVASLLERLRLLREQGFAVTDVPHRGICLTCPGRGTLCSWDEARTSRQLSPTLGPPSRVATLTV
jgi:ATP-dependent helicase/nuclease subunit A